MMDNDVKLKSNNLENIWNILSPNSIAAMKEIIEQSNLITETNSNDSSLYLTTKNADFKEENYWNQRFTSEESYDWLLTFPELKEFLVPYIQPDNKILVIGCGNSSFSSDLYDEGFNNITNIDFSDIVIEKMKERNKIDRPSMLWIKMDMTELASFDDESFDVVIDKAAMDALMVDEGDVWNPIQDVIKITDKMCMNISRCLRSAGFYIQISFMQPHFRTKYLMGDRLLPIEYQSSPYSTLEGKCDRYLWNLNYSTVNVELGCLNSFIYFMKKKLN